METFPKNSESPLPKEESEEQKTAEKVVENLKFVISRLNEEEKNGLKYAVVGGVALTAWTNSEYSPLRENKTVRDLDVIVLDDPEGKIPEIKKEIQKQATNFILPTELLSVKTEDYQSQKQLLTHIKKKGGDYCLIFRDVEKKVPQELIELQQVNLRIGEENLNIETFLPGTLLHLYLGRAAGHLKHKDLTKIKKFLRENPELRNIAKHPKEHVKYRVFHEFAKEVREKYPVYSAAIKAYNLIDRALFNSLISHKLIPRKLFKKLIDL